MTNSQFKVGDVVTVQSPQLLRGGFKGMRATVKQVIATTQPNVARVQLDLSESSSKDQWFFSDELALMGELAPIPEETLEAKRDRLKAELAKAEVEIRNASRPRASRLAVGTAIGYTDLTTGRPALDIKQGPNMWLRARLPMNHDNYLPVTQHRSDFDVQDVIDRVWGQINRLDIYPGK